MSKTAVCSRLGGSVFVHQGKQNSFRKKRKGKKNDVENVVTDHSAARTVASMHCIIVNIRETTDEVFPSWASFKLSEHPLLHLFVGPLTLGETTHKGSLKITLNRRWEIKFNLLVKLWPKLEMGNVWSQSKSCVWPMHNNNSSSSLNKRLSV